MTRIPLTWRRELAAQALLRKKIALKEKQFGQATLDVQRALRDGGPGWTTRAGQAELRAERAWKQVRTLLSKLYNRKVVD